MKFPRVAVLWSVLTLSKRSRIDSDSKSLQVELGQEIYSCLTSRIDHLYRFNTDGSTVLKLHEELTFGADEDDEDRRPQILSPTGVVFRKPAFELARSKYHAVSRRHVYPF